MGRSLQLQFHTLGRPLCGLVFALERRGVFVGCGRSAAVGAGPGRLRMGRSPNSNSGCFSSVACAGADPFCASSRLGSSLERSIAFLNMLQQMGVLGCMIGYPEGGANSRLLHWIPGALVDKEIFLFD